MADKIDSEAFQSMLTSAEADITATDLFSTKKNTWSQDMHTSLAAAGMIPGVGNIADLMDAALYGLEGDKYGMGLSLISAIPALGLVSGGLKIKKGAKLSKELDKQTGMVTQAQDIVKSYGKDPLNPSLVSDIVDITSDTATNFAKSGKQMETLLNKGMNYEDALDVMMYYDSKSKRAIKASEDLKKIGMSEMEIFGKEAVEEMTKRKERGMRLALDDAISGKYGLAKIFE